MSFRLKVFVVTCFMAIALIASQNVCRITDDVACNSNHVFTAVTDNQGLILITKDGVPAGTKLFLACSSQDSVEVLCQYDGTFAPDLKTIRKCNTALPIFVQQTDQNCGSNGKMLQVGYNVAYGSAQGQILSLYRSCYNAGGIQTYYTQHAMRRYDTHLCRASTDFTGGNIISRDIAESYSEKKVFSTFKMLLGEAIAAWFPDGDKSTIISRGHLAPSKDFPFFYLMKATFHLVNAVPMFQKINGGNWLKIENWARNIAARLSYVHIITGGHDILELPHSIDDHLVKMYLNPHWGIPIPKYIYKIVSFQNYIYTFITYNNPFALTYPKPICPPTNCPDGFATPTTWNDLSKGYTYCCRIDDVKDILKLSPLF